MYVVGVGVGEAEAPALAIGSGLGSLDARLECPPLGGGAGILGSSSFSETELPCFFTLLAGACAVFMLEYGLNVLFFVSLCVSNGFLNVFLALAGLGCVSGEALRLTGAGWKLSSITLTKLLGNRPIALGSLLSLPIHH